MNIKVIVKPLGYMALGLAAAMSLAAAWGVRYAERETLAILSAMAACGAAGALMVWIGGRFPLARMKRRESILIVGLGWIVGAFFCSLPFVFAGAASGFNSPVDAYFEAMSGLTTTGASILTDIESVPRSLLFWRSFTHWIGGMGIIVLFVAVMPFLGVTGKQLMKSEVPGPTMERFKPRIVDTARLLWFIYIGLSLAETLALMLCGLDLYDALCHTFGTMATGGFSTKNLSIGHFQSIPVMLVITFFMILAGINFSLYYAAFMGRPKLLYRDAEFRTYIGGIAILTILVTINLVRNGIYDSSQQSAAHALFQVTSINTTTGYGTADFDAWPAFSKMLLFFLMFVGGCAGSTGGGVKVVRMMIGFKHAVASVFRTVHPESVVSMRIGRGQVRPEVIQQVQGFFAWTAVIFVGGSLVVAGFGHDMITAMSATVATLFNIGPGLALVGPMENYAFFHPALKLFLSMLMVLGRLELFTILALFSRHFWKK